MEEPVILEQTDGVAVLTLNRPDRFNAFDADMVRLLARRLTALSGDSGIRGVVITGKERAFCAGGDLRWVAGCGRPYGAVFHELAAHYHQAIVEIRRMPKPVVAAVNGLAAGGGFSMALACDFRVMAASAVLLQAYTSNGLSIDGGGTFTLPRLVGLAKALEIVAFDRPIAPEQALSWGLVTEVAADGTCVERAVGMIREMTAGSLNSFAAAKRLMTDSFHSPFEVQLENERQFLSMCGDHADGREGIAAFLEKRRPVYGKSDKGESIPE